MRLNAVDVDGKVSASFNYTLLESVYNLISGDVSFKTEISLKVYLSFKHQYLELKCDCNLKINVKISGKTDIKKIKLGPPLGFVVAPGVIVEFTPSFLIQASAEISGSFQLSGTIGFKLESGTGLTNLTSQPKVKMESKGEVSIFIGISFEPKLKILSDQIASTSLEAAVGVEIKGTRIFETSKISSSEVHECKDCVDGDIVGKIDVSFKLGFFNIENLTYKLQKSSSVKMFDWYLSLDFGEFGFTTCPHIMYKSTVVVTDQNGEPIKDALVELPYTITDPPFENKLVTSVVTDSEGNAEGYLKNGTYTAKISANGYESTTKNVTINNFAKKFKINLNKLGGSGGDGENSGGSGSDMYNNISMISLGRAHSAVVMEDGSLCMWGSNSMGQLGKESEYASVLEPLKIMDNVVSVSLGYDHSGAITKDGSLYMWGGNGFGEIGYGTTSYSENVPIKVLEHVISVSLGYEHTGAVTEDGSLYMWGLNSYGKLGDGTTDNKYLPTKILENITSVSLGHDCSGAITRDGDLYVWGRAHADFDDFNTPVKILSNVVSVSLGRSHGGAVTKDGSLYMWGLNSYGKLGDGTTKIRYSPVKVLENVISVSLGDDSSGAITKDGSLYMWGENLFGKLGDGTTEDKYMPVKILENVIAVNLGEDHSGAITKDGSLYMWGLNGSGQIGDGLLYGEEHVPIKVLDNVRQNNKQTNIQKLSKFSVDTLSIKQLENLNLSKIESVNDRNNQISTFTNIIPYATYMFYMVKDRSVDDILNTSNLLYLTQAVANADGNLSVTYVPKETIADAAVFLVGADQQDLSSAAVTMPDLEYNQKLQYIQPSVTYNGKILKEWEDYELLGDYSATDVGAYTVTIHGIGDYKGAVDASYKITEAKSSKVEKITLSVADALLNTGNTLQLIAEVFPESAENKTLQWSSSNEQVATVDSNGHVAAIGVGQATITVKSQDGSDVSASCVITVTRLLDNPSGGGSSGGSSSGGSAGSNPSSGSTGNDPGSNPSENDPDNGNNGELQVKLLYYIVDFNANGGNSLSRKTMTLLMDDTLGILPKIQRKKYDFKGWYTQISGGEKVTQATVLNVSTTLYAQWAKTAKLAKPAKLSMTAKKGRQMKVSYKKVSGASGYQIAYSTSKKFASSATKKVTTSSTSKILKNLKKGKTYYVRVRAYKTDSAGNKVYGTYSEKKSIKIKA